MTTKLDEAVQRYVDHRDPAQTEADAMDTASLALDHRLRHREYLMATVLLGEALAGQTIGVAGVTTLDHEQALHLAVTMINAEVVNIRIGDSQMQRDLVLRHIRTVHETEQAAAFAAVRQLGGWRRVGIPEWMDSALGDSENWTACACVIDRAELDVMHTNPGRRWECVPSLGYVVYQPA
jgi:hypothetical protein